MGYALTYVFLASFVAMVVAGTALWLTVPPQPSKTWIVLSPVAAGGWAMGDFLSNLALTPEVLRTLSYSIAPFWAPLPFLALWTALHYTQPAESRWRRPVVGLALALPALGCVALVVTGTLHTRYAPASANGHYFVPHASVWHQAVNAYFLAYIISAAVMLWRAARRSTDPMVRAMAHFFVRGMIPATLIGALANGGLVPMGLDPPHVGSVMACVVIGVVTVGVAQRGFFRPIYEVARARDEALDSLTRRDALIQALPFGVAIVDPDSRGVLLGNDAFSELVSPSQVAALLEPITLVEPGAADEASPVTRTEAVLDPQAEPPKVLRVHAARLTYGDRPAWLVGVRDISRERALEGRVRQSEQLQSLGTLAGGIAHDMNNILAVIMLLADGLDPETMGPEATRKSARRIVGACRRGRDLTGNILAYTHQRTPQQHPVSVPGLLQSTLDLVRPSLPDAVVVETQLDPGLPDLAGDETQLQQALANLCRNAAEAMPKGGCIRILGDVVQQSAAELAGAVPSGQESPRPGSFLRLQVQDNGDGMDDTTRRRCLEPLYTTKPIGRGTGLGLAVTHGTVTRHGGLLQVESTPGEGTCMTLLFPLPPNAPRGVALFVQESSGDPSWNAPEGLPPPEVLLVEDEPDLRLLARRELEALGCHVVEAANGREALDLTDDHVGALDLVLLDLVMPEVDGAETFRELHRRAPWLPVVLMSGYSHEADVQDLLAGGASGFLAKPFDRRLLAASVRRALATRVFPRPRTEQL